MVFGRAPARAVGRLVRPLSIRKMATATEGSYVKKKVGLMTASTSGSNSEVRIPRLIYGTAWKKERTAQLAYHAIRAGFKGIDTAAQPRHYQEDLVGEGIQRAIEEGIVKREDLYIQTKYTPISGQDLRNMPYSASQSIPDQIHSSIASSLSHFTFPGLGEPYIDCLLLHSPLPTLEETYLAWQTLETYVPSKIRSLGISNVPLPYLISLYEDRVVKPSVVQNRFYPATKWEVPLRQYCREKGIVFESFWTLTGNPQLLQTSLVGEIAEELEKLDIHDSKSVALYALVLGLEGTSALNGTTNEERMQSDLAGLELVGKMIEGEWKEKWGTWIQTFRKIIRDVEGTG